MRPREKRTKLSLHYDGPFHVRKQLPGPEGREGNVYVLADGEGNEVIKPASDLKTFLPPITECTQAEHGVDFVVESDDETVAAEERLESSHGMLPQEEFDLLFVETGSKWTNGSVRRR